jgi:hypothetical protein
MWAVAMLQTLSWRCVLHWMTTDLDAVTDGCLVIANTQKWRTFTTNLLKQQAQWPLAASTAAD